MGRNGEGAKKVTFLPFTNPLLCKVNRAFATAKTRFVYKFLAIYYDALTRIVIISQTGEL